MPAVYQEFQSAPMGRRVVVPVIFTFAIVFIAVAIDVFFAAAGPQRRVNTPDKMAVALVPLASLLLVPVFLYERSKVSRFRIEESCLVLGKKRYPLEGLVEVGRDPEVMRRAVRVWGNGGMGSIRGIFWSRRMGRFYAFLSGTENAVVLRWKDKAVVVSPLDPETFIHTARSAGGMRRPDPDGRTGNG